MLTDTEAAVLLPAAAGFAAYLGASQEEAADLAQEALYRALVKAGAYDRSRAMRPWVLSILKNAYLDRLKAHGRARAVCLDYPGEDGLSLADRLAGPDRPDMDAERREVAGRVRGVLRALSATHREVLALCDMGGEAYGNAAASLGVPIGTVRSRLSRAREAFRAAWGVAYAD